MGKRGPHPTNLGLLQYWEEDWLRVFKGLRDGSPAVLVGVGPAPLGYVATNWRERDFWEKLLKARSPTRVREICKQSGLWDQRASVREIYKRAEEFIAGREFREVLLPSIPAERNLWQGLKTARTFRQVRVICEQSKRWLNPRWGGKVFVAELSQHADQFLVSKKSIRYPGSKRPSSDDKRLRYFARVMAGIMMDRQPRTAIDLLGSEKARNPAAQGPIGQESDS